MFLKCGLGTALLSLCLFNLQLIIYLTAFKTQNGWVRTQVSCVGEVAGFYTKDLAVPSIAWSQDKYILSLDSIDYWSWSQFPIRKCIWCLFFFITQVTTEIGARNSMILTLVVKLIMNWFGISSSFHSSALTEQKHYTRDKNSLAIIANFNAHVI
jgi:hypothetical protein